jgi:hypothetical protein
MSQPTRPTPTPSSTIASFHGAPPAPSPAPDPGSTVRLAPPPLRDLLRAHAAQQVPLAAVLRAIMLHRGFLAPVPFLRSVAAPAPALLSGPAQVLTIDTHLPVGRLWLFSDRTAADAAVAAGLQPGLFAPEVSGAAIFSHLGARAAAGHPPLEVLVDPGGPAEASFYVPASATELTWQWARAIELESCLHPGAPAAAIDPRLRARLHHHATFHVPICQPATWPSSWIVGIPCEGMRSAAVACTTEDNLAAFWRSLDAAVQRHVRTWVTDGATLFATLARQGYDGVIVNPAGPGRRAPFATAALVADGTPPLCR